MNRDSYNKIAPIWDVARSRFVGYEREYLDLLLATTPTGATILDLGCGTGRPMAEYILSKGYHVLGVDQAEAMLQLACQRFPYEQWILASMESYEPVEGYHGALFWDSLFHIQRTQHKPIIGKVVRKLPLRGRFMLTVGGSAHPEFTDCMYGEEFYYDSNTPEETLAFLHQLSCRVIIGEYIDLPDGGRNKGRYAIVAEKSK